MRRLREEREAPSGLDSASAIDARRAELRRRTLDLLDELRISPDQLRALSRQFRDEFEQAIPALPTRDGEPVKVIPAADVPDTIGGETFKEAVWTTFLPPFLNTNSFFDGWVESAFTFEKDLFLEASSGIVGHRLSLNNGDAGNDLAQIEQNASIIFGHTMPANGRLDIWIEGECLHSSHHLSLVDEWGVSSAFSWQQNWLVAKADGVAADSWQKTLASEFQASGDAEGTWHHQPYPDGETGWANLVTENWFPKDSWVSIQVGTTSWHRANTDDMEFYSQMDFTWRVKKVIVKMLE